MSKKKRGLGRGLDALLGPNPAVLEDENEEQAQQLHLLPLHRVQRGQYQPRRDIQPESLQELAASIREQGVVQPIVVRPLADGLVNGLDGQTDGEHYEIVAGERRWRAAQLAGLDEIPALVRGLSDRDALGVALIENIQREDLNPLEEATALQRLVNEFEMTHQQVAEAVGRSRTAVTNLLRLLDLDEAVKQLVFNGKLEMGHARALLSLDSVSQQRIANLVVANALSVRETERMARRVQAEQSTQPKGMTNKKDADTARLETDLSERLGAAVAVKHNSKGRGSVVIYYSSLDELEGILGHIK